MLEKVDFHFDVLREKAENHYHFMIKYKRDSYLNSFIWNYSQIFEGFDLMCSEDKSQNGPKGKKVSYSVFSSLFFDGINFDDFFKKKLFFYFIKVRDLAHRYSISDGGTYSKDFHTYTTIPNEKNIIKIVGGAYGNFDNYFQIDEFYYDSKNYIKKENGLIKYDFKKFQLHSCSKTKKNSLIARKLEENHDFLCKDCNKKILIYGYLIPWYCKDSAYEKIVPYLNEDKIKFKESKDLEERQLYLNLTESVFQVIYDQYVAMHNAKYTDTDRIVYEEPNFNDEFYNDDRDLDDQSQEFWDSQ